MNCELKKYCALGILLCGFSLFGQAAEVLPDWALGAFVRPEGVNPMISPQPKSTFFCPMRDAVVNWELADTFNPAAVEKDGRVYVLYRAEDNPDVGIGDRTSRVGYVESADGLHIDYRAPEPVCFPNKSEISRTYEWDGGVEDPRIVEAQVDGKRIFVMTHTSWNHDTPRLSIATSQDLKGWNHWGPAFSKAYGGKFLEIACKSGSILTQEKDGRLQAVRVKVNGEMKYFMYWGETGVYAATSDNLTDWTPLVDEKGDLLCLASPRKGFFDSALTECGPPAVLTDKGIVLLYNGKNLDQGGDAQYPARTYAAGQMLFSRDNPLQYVTRLDKPFFYPMSDFEKSGQYVDGTVFIEGLVLHQGSWFLYYGCADSRVAVAVWKP